MDDISIDRLILEVPNLSSADARLVASKVGQRLAGGAAAAGRYETLSVTLDRRDLGEPMASLNGKADAERLANEISAALLRRIG